MIKKVTITLAILWNSFFLSPTGSIQAQPNFTPADGIVREATNVGAIDSDTQEALGDNRLNRDPSTLSSQEQATMLDSTVEFFYFTCTGYNAMHASLGTKLDEHTILTHNHFGVQANFCMIDPVDPAHPHDVAIKTASVALGHGDEVGDQTQLVQISEAMSGPYAPIASQQEMGALLVGEFVEVVYRDDASSKLAIISLQIRGFLGSAVLVLDDPEDIINIGDSGGGVYYQGALIGNTWRYLLTLDQDNQVIDKQVHVHLLPMEIEMLNELTD